MEAWGKDQAKAWAIKLRKIIFSRLTTLTLACPISPETDELGLSVRQLRIQRYRVLFIVSQRTVTILHVRGPYRAELD